jgi:hypothetical protein
VEITADALTGASLNDTAFVGLGKNAAWTFTTKANAPTATEITVDDNGAADFRTVQGALNHVMQNVAAATPVTINVKNGDYEELLFLRGKNNLTIRGESRDGVVIHYTNNNLVNSGTGTSQAPGVASLTGGRSVFLAESSDLLVIDNLTLKNTTLIGNGGQAEVIYFNNDAGRLVVSNSNLISEQDTVQVKGYSWFYRSLVAGNVDFIWGNNRVALFEESEIRSLGDSRGNASGGYVLQARTVSAADKGFVFLNSRLTRGAGPLGHTIADGQTWLARSGGSTTYFDNVVFVNTKMDAHIQAAGWYTAPMPNPAAATTTTGWREYGSTDLAGTSLNTANRDLVSGQLSVGDVISNYCSRAQIFSAFNSGAGWDPLPGNTTDCLNFDMSGSSSSTSSAASSAVSSVASSSSTSSESSVTSSSSSVASSVTSSSSSNSSSSSAAVVVATKTWGFDSATYAAADTNLFGAAYNAAGDNGIKITASPVSVDGLDFYSAATSVLRYRAPGSANNSSATGVWNTNGSFFTSNSVLMPEVGSDVTSVRTYISIPVESDKAFTITLNYKQTSATATAGKVALVGSDNKVLIVKDASNATTAASGDSLSLTVPAGHTYTSVKIFYGREGITSGGVNITSLVRVQ